MDVQSLGRMLVLLGLGIAITGGILMLFGRIFPSEGGFAGDIKVQTRNISCFAPIGTMLILSIILTIVLNVAIRLLNK